MKWPHGAKVKVVGGGGSFYPTGNLGAVRRWYDPTESRDIVYCTICNRVGGPRGGGGGGG